MADRRHAPHIVRCSWCFAVNATGRWIPERRGARGESYANRLCSQCISFMVGDAEPTAALRRNEEPEYWR